MNTQVSNHPVIPVTADYVKAFYLEHLVPAGQSLALVAACYDNMQDRALQRSINSTRPGFLKVGYGRYGNMLLEEGFGPLHLVNCYLQSRKFRNGAVNGDYGLMTPIANILFRMRDALCTQVKAWVLCHHPENSVTSADERIFEVVTNPRQTARRVMKLTKERAVEMENVILYQRKLQAQLLQVLGATSVGDEAWIAQYVNTASPLCIGGRMGTWRTLVNNLPWDGVAKTLKLTGVPKPTWLGSRPGREQVDGLMERAFAPFEAEQVPPAPVGEKLPEGVTLTSTADGYIDVVGTFVNSRAKVLVELDVTVEELTGAGPNIQAWLKLPSSLKVGGWVCSYKDLPDVVKSARSEIDFEAEIETRVIVELREFVGEMKAQKTQERRDSLLAQLHRTFSPEDIEELKVLISNGA